MIGRTGHADLPDRPIHDRARLFRADGEEILLALLAGRNRWYRARIELAGEKDLAHRARQAQQVGEEAELRAVTTVGALFERLPGFHVDRASHRCYLAGRFQEIDVAVLAVARGIAAQETQ